MKKLFIEGLIAFFAILGILYLISLAASRLSFEPKMQVAQTLFDGHCGNSFNIKTIVIANNGNTKATTETMLKNVQWAQLRLYPTIGCTRPTLFYLADNSQQVKMIEVNDAKVIN